MIDFGTFWGFHAIIKNNKTIKKPKQTLKFFILYVYSLTNFQKVDEKIVYQSQRRGMVWEHFSRSAFEIRGTNRHEDALHYFI